MHRYSAIYEEITNSKFAICYVSNSEDMFYVDVQKRMFFIQAGNGSADIL